MAVEAQSVWMKDASSEADSRVDHLDVKTSHESTTDYLELDTTLEASLFEDVEFEEAPPMIQAMRLLGRLLDADLAQRALEVGDDAEDAAARADAGQSAVQRSGCLVCGCVSLRVPFYSGSFAGVLLIYTRHTHIRPSFA